MKYCPITISIKWIIMKEYKLFVDKLYNTIYLLVANAIKIYA